MTIPSQINLGSGKIFLDDHLNIDISDLWRPDIVTDMSQPGLIKSGKTFETKRFGEVTLKPESFDTIMANDVLEHVPDLMSLMTNCLELLRTGGLFHIKVPYDLSYGAWQDPTHIRGFNERSFLYYTDWFWYMGWKTHRFTQKSIDLVLSPIGEQLQKESKTNTTLMLTPRAIDDMKVTLTKIALTAADKETLSSYWQTRPE